MSDLPSRLGGQTGGPPFFSKLQVVHVEKIANEVLLQCHQKRVFMAATTLSVDKASYCDVK